jgi:hypothetical protein
MDLLFHILDVVNYRPILLEIILLVQPILAISSIILRLPMVVKVSPTLKPMPVK